jgi:RNA polymerase sigma-70 factor (ECF subfamily)
VHLTDEQIKKILNGCRLNKRDAQKELYRNFYNYALSIAFCYTNKYDSAAEIANEAFLKIYQELKNLAPRFDDSETSFMARLRKLVVNACIDHKRNNIIDEVMASVDSVVFGKLKTA